MKGTSWWSRLTWPALALAAVLSVVALVPHAGFGREGKLWAERGGAPIICAGYRDTGHSREACSRAHKAFDLRLHAGLSLNGSS